MKKKYFFLTILTLCLSYFADCQEVKKSTSWPHGVTYEIFVQSFADSDKDGIGDLNGVILKLDYLADLGIDAIWFMPIHPSPTYHKYDVANYFEIHPDYGTIENFKRLISEAHKRNIKIIIDLVINHTSTENPWFREAIKNKQSKFWDYYIWKQCSNQKATENSFEESSIHQAKTRWFNIPTGDYCYFGHFSSRMPDLNFDNQAVKNDIIKIGRYWLEEIGVDGFRLDAAKHIFPDDRNTDNLNWWKYFKNEMEKVKKDVYLVGEVWGPAEETAPYLEGFTAVFNFEIQSEILNAVVEEDGSKLVEKHMKINELYSQYNHSYIDATFLSNHDIVRLKSLTNDDPCKAKISASLLLTLPGSPYIYYGEEIGMTGKKPDKYIREPFIWDKYDQDTLRTKWITSLYSDDSTVVPAELQMKDDASILNHYKKLIQLRKNCSALALGDIKKVDFGIKNVCAFTRSCNKKTVLVMHNLSEKATILDIKEDYMNFKNVMFTNARSFVTKKQIILDGFSTIVIEAD